MEDTLPIEPLKEGEAPTQAELPTLEQTEQAPPTTQEQNLVGFTLEGGELGETQRIVLEPEPVTPVHKVKPPKDKVIEVLLADLIRGMGSETLGPVRLAAVLRHIGSNASAPKIWLNHEFHILMKDFKKAKTPKLKKVRQASLIQFLQPGQTTGVSVEDARREPSGPQSAEAKEINAQDEAELTPQQRQNYEAYVDRQRQERFRKDPQKSADEAAQIIKSALAKGGWNGAGEFSVYVPITTNVMWLEAACRRAQIRFSAIRYTVALRNATIGKGTGMGDAERDGKPGKQWQVTLS